MEVEKFIEEYNKQNEDNILSLYSVIKDVMDQVFSSIDEDLYTIVCNVKSGNYSLLEIADSIDAVRRKIY